MAVVAGLWLIDQQGREKFTPATSNVTVLGIIETGKSNGSVTNARLAKGTPVILGALPLAGSGYAVPTFTVSGNTISWTFRNSGANTNQSCRFAYGFRA